MRGQVHLQQPDVIQQPTGWLTRIAGPVMEPVLHEYCNAQTHIAPASARSPLQVAHLAVQAHVPYARRRHRHRAFAHYARNLCNQFAHCQAYRLCPISRNTYMHTPQPPPSLPPVPPPRGRSKGDPPPGRAPLPTWPVTRSEIWKKTFPGARTTGKFFRSSFFVD